MYCEDIKLGRERCREEISFYLLGVKLYRVENFIDFSFLLVKNLIYRNFLLDFMIGGFCCL